MQDSNRPESPDPAGESLEDRARRLDRQRVAPEEETRKVPEPPASPSGAPDAPRSGG